MPKAKKESKALTLPTPKLLSAQAQNLYDQMSDLKDDMKKAREKRQNALMQNGRYEALKQEAQQIVKEAGDIQKNFDAQHPEYKDDIKDVAEEAKKVSAGLSRIAVEAMRKGIALEVFDGRGPGKKRVSFNIIAQPSLF